MVVVTLESTIVKKFKFTSKWSQVLCMCLQKGSRTVLVVKGEVITSQAKVSD